jgi:hypothetical protein
MFLLGWRDNSFVQHCLQSGDLVVVRVLAKDDRKQNAVTIGRGRAGFMVLDQTDVNGWRESNVFDFSQNN